MAGFVPAISVLGDEMKARTAGVKPAMTLLDPN
jgi:hypothetical protein